MTVAISVEAAELLELFRWKDEQKVSEDIADELFKIKVGEEISDVIILCTSLANTLNLKLENIIADKIEKNTLKYPPENTNKYNNNWQSR